MTPSKPHNSHPAAQLRFGQAVRKLRKSHQKHFSQEDFALEADINRGYMGAIERGEVNVSLLTVEKICAALEVSMENLFGCAKL
jgi:DNA-binding XRE family transcriptional regulator